MNTEKGQLETKRKYHRLYMRLLHETNPEYILRDAFYGMRKRCYSQTCKNYPNYGGRGIYVCDEWRNSFHAFKDWALASGWKPGLEIDRINNDGPYSPENCRCVTHEANSRNRRDNKLTLEQVESMRAEMASGVPGIELARRYGVHHSLIYRIKQNKIWKTNTQNSSLI